MSRQPQPSDRRGFGRRESLIHAFAGIAGRPKEPCIVRNFSDGGALLEFKVMPSHNGLLQLVVESKGIDVVCEVRHQTDRLIGVRFPADGAAVATSRYAALLAEAEAPPPPTAPVVFTSEGVVTVVSGADVRRLMVAPTPA